MFSALHDRYKSEKSALTPVVAPPTAPLQLISASSGHSLKAYRFQSLHKCYTARGALVRAISEAPHQHDPFADKSMNLFSDLDQGSQAELAGNAAEPLVKAAKDIAEGSQSGVMNPPKAPVVEEQLGDEMEVDPKMEIGKAAHRDKGTLSATRQSTRAKVVPIILTAGDEQELSDEEDEDEIEEDRTLVWMLLGKMKNSSGQAFLITLRELLIDVPQSFGKTIYETCLRLQSDAPVEVQVQGLRQSLAADVEYDYTTTIRATTLETVLENAQNPDGLVLNALQLPSGHMVHSNPLIDSGLNLEYMAYRHTNGLPGFVRRYPPYSELHWQLFGTIHALSIMHFDVAATWVFVEGPGEKFWVQGRSRDRGSMADQGVDTRFHDLQDSFVFEDWEPDDANLQGCEYEGVVLTAGHWTLLAAETAGLRLGV
ncbi:hypothetical protein C8R44DRAFT_863785 [Mycena epipterygia]|nr:hypothetical protein C8R44DRAFT_863785 [Mycena epipterygia]